MPGSNTQVGSTAHIQSNCTAHSNVQRISNYKGVKFKEYCLYTARSGNDQEEIVFSGSRKNHMCSNCFHVVFSIIRNLGCFSYSGNCATVMAELLEGLTNYINVLLTWTVCAAVKEV